VNKLTSFFYRKWSFGKSLDQWAVRNNLNVSEPTRKKSGKLTSSLLQMALWRNFGFMTGRLATPAPLTAERVAAFCISQLVCRHLANFPIGDYAHTVSLRVNEREKEETGNPCMRLKENTLGFTRGVVFAHYIWKCEAISAGSLPDSPFGAGEFVRHDRGKRGGRFRSMTRGWCVDRESSRSPTQVRRRLLGGRRRAA